MKDMDNTWQERLLKKYYRDRQGWQSGCRQFWQLIKEYAQGGNILEIGAGPTNNTTAVLSDIGSVTGLDIDPLVRTNVHCTETVVYDGMHFPFQNDHYDLAISDYVCEHLKHPLELAREINRVLRPGGHYILRTPNVWHYVPLTARLTPQWFHLLVANWLRNLHKGIHDPQPTYYRMNTKRSCHRILTSAGFEIELLRVIEPEPSYGFASRLLFYPFMLWEKILNCSPLFENLRANILCVARAEKGLPV